MNCGLDLLAALVAMTLTVGGTLAESCSSSMADDAVYVYLTTTSRLQIVYRQENRRRDMQYGKPPPDVPVDTTILADKVHVSSVVTG